MIAKNLMTTSLLTAFAFSITSIFSFPLFAQTNNKQARWNRRDRQQLWKLINRVQKKDPTKGISRKLRQVNNTTFASNQDSLSVEMDISSKKTRVAHARKGKISVYIPNSHLIDAVDVVDDKVIYTSSNNTETIVEAVDGGIRQLININSKDAPSTYDFLVELEAGDKLQANEEGAVVTNKDNQVKLVIAKPWAKDANGKDLKTWYTVAGNVLRQHINFTDAAFPVVADPTWCGDLITIGRGWADIWYGNVKYRGLQILPTWCGRLALPSSIVVGSRGVIFGGQYVGHIASSAWLEVLYKSPRDWSWNKAYGTSTYWSLHDQFICHLYNPFTLTKFDYNIESDRPRVGLAQTYLNGCNPRK